MVKVILLAVALALGGCATKPPQTVYITAPAAKPPVIARPVLDTSKITDTTSDSVAIQLMASSIAQLINYARQLETALDAYK